MEFITICLNNNNVEATGQLRFRFDNDLAVTTRSTDRVFTCTFGTILVDLFYQKPSGVRIIRSMTPIH
jgi:hypothetical protein